MPTTATPEPTCSPPIPSARNRAALAKFGLAEKLAEIVRAGARLAREAADAAGRPVYVAGSIGPLPAQPREEPMLDDMIVEQAQALVEGGADFVLFETQPNRAAVERCAAWPCAACPTYPLRSRS